MKPGVNHQVFPSKKRFMCVSVLNFPTGTISQEVDPYIPYIKTGGEPKKTSDNILEDFDVDFDKNLLRAKSDHKAKQSKQKETLDDRFGEFGGRKVNKESNNGMKRNVLDYMKIKETKFMEPKVPRRICVKGPGAASGLVPQSIEVSRQRLKDVLTKDVYIDTETLDAGLSLIDRKLSEDSKYVEGVIIYDNTMLRLISMDDRSPLQSGPFLAVLPRQFVVAEEEEQMKMLRRGVNRPDVVLGHFTLISNIHCSSREVNIFETLPAYRRPSTLLTEAQKCLLKVLTNTENDILKVNCVNVFPQEESECGSY